MGRAAAKPICRTYAALSYDDGFRQMGFAAALPILQGFFESLVVDLIVRMGYGGSRREAGLAIGRSGDEGIDGIVKEDRLGLDIILAAVAAEDGAHNPSRPGYRIWAPLFRGSQLPGLRKAPCQVFRRFKPVGNGMEPR